VIVTFTDYQPIPRYDGFPWTHAIIEESPDADGPWTQIDDVVFPDPDPEPENPKARSFTTNNGTLAEGWYRVTFYDAAGDYASPTAPVHVSKNRAYAPNVAQVARKILSRTRDQYGNTLGTFNTNTTPTEQQVSAIILDVLPNVADEVGDEIPPEYFDDAAEVVALRAAMQVELDFFPDQVATDRSPYPQLADLYEKELERLRQSISVAVDGEPVDTAPSNRPSGSFPEPFFRRDMIW